MVTVEKKGRRLYVRGLTYNQRQLAKEAGGRWDPQEKAWWFGSTKSSEASEVAGKANSGGGGGGERAASSPPGPGLDATIAGQAKYNGRTYYVAGKIDHGRSHWDDRVDMVGTRDGKKILLYFRDGSSQFWADRDKVDVVKSYSKPNTIRKVKDYAKSARTFGTGECRCRCHDEPNAGRPGSTLFDGCDRCGCEV